jgi:hypothetical protein
MSREIENPMSTDQNQRGRGIRLPMAEGGYITRNGSKGSPVEGVTRIWNGFLTIRVLICSKIRKVHVKRAKSDGPWDLRIDGRSNMFDTGRYHKYSVAIGSA